MKEVGLFFGSFNPIHIGHLALANYIREFENLDEVWFVVSPQNPFKQSSELLDAELRLKMVDLATQDQENYKAIDIELQLPTPSYTIKTLDALKSQYTNCQFSIIMGADNAQRLHHWKSYDEIISEHQILIYPRAGYIIDEEILHHNARLTKAPLVEMASSNIREWIRDGKETPYLIPERVYNFIQQKNLYR